MNAPIKSWMNRLLPIFCLLFLTQACLTPRPVMPTRYYTLTPVSTNETEPAPVGVETAFPEMSVEIGFVYLPQYLEKPRIAIRKNENQLTFLEYYQWGGSLRKNLIQVLSHNLSVQLASPRIWAAPFHGGSPPDVKVEVQVLAFEPDPGGQVVLTARWRLSRGYGPWETTRLETFSGPKTDNALDVDRLVRHMSQVWGKLCLEVGNDILILTGEDLP